MSQEKAQLIAPLGVFAVDGVTATGVITATSLIGNIAGAAKSVVQGTSVTAGVVTASSFAGNLTGNIQRLADSGPNISVGVVSATSFSGNLTGSVTDLTGTPTVTAGVVTATRLQGTVTGDITGDVVGNVVGVATGNVTGDVSGLAQGGLGVNYNGGWTGAGTSQINAGVVTATSFYGDGSTLTGVTAGAVTQQAVTANSSTTAIDLSSGNLIYLTQTATTTISFTNASNGNIYIIRVDNFDGVAKHIIWPSSVKWNNNSPPNPVTNSRTTAAQAFKLTTRDEGTTWYATEIINCDPDTYALMGWGTNSSGTLGQNNSNNLYRSSPTQIGNASDNWNFVVSSMQDQRMAAMRSDGTLWTWGRNNDGELGLNDENRRSSPTQVGTDATWNDISVGGDDGAIFLATKTDGTLWTWGKNDSGGLGLNESSNNDRRSSPTQVGTPSDSDGAWSRVNVGRGCAAIRGSGTLWTWGNNEYGGMLGHNNKTDYSSPREVGTTADWASCKISRPYNTVAVKTNGTLWTWGLNNNGALGLNQPEPTGYSSPKQVGTDTTWGTPYGAVASTYYGWYNIKSDGTLWACGWNSDGKLGVNDTANRSSPTQVGTDATWSAIASSYKTTIASKTDGTMWVWGSADSGALGLNTSQESVGVADKMSSPTQLPGSWNTGTAGGSVASVWLATFALAEK